MCPPRCKTCLTEIVLGDQCEECRRTLVDQAFTHVLERHGEALDRLAEI